ncbi:MAG: IclR family transcriptional regulator [Propioniciclava sp.]
MTAPAHEAAPPSQTLSRGIQILELLAATATPISIDAVAEHLDVHRSIAYRLVRTLEHHGLVRRDPAGGVVLGTRLAALAAGVSRDLQAEALPELTAVANELQMTCFLAVLDRDECITLASVAPRDAVATVAQRPGSRHPVTMGAPGKAILAQLPVNQWPSVPEGLATEIAQVATAGYATSQGEVIATVQAVAVPLRLRGQQPAALAVIHVAGQLVEPATLAARLQRAAAAITRALEG